jgi:hypothetical protein
MLNSKHVLRLCCAAVYLFLVGCSASYIKVSVPDNPLDRVSEKAQMEWSVERVDSNTLELSDAWPFSCIARLGYVASHAILYYDPAGSELHVQYYLKTFPLVTLWIPISVDAEPGGIDGRSKPLMRIQIDQIIEWTGGRIMSRHSVARSDPFPPTSEPTMPASD